jgi:hypothetical protein
METTGLCARIRAWQELYPDPVATPSQNAASRAAEDGRLAPFAGLETLSLDQVTSLINWKFGSMPHRRSLALRGITPERWQGNDGEPGAAGLIHQALTTSDDYQALALTASPTGVYRFGPAMASVLLAACRPDRYTVADSRALEALRALGLMPPGPVSFRLADWLPYLGHCRDLAGSCGVSLRYVDRALWVAAAHPGLLP